MGNTSNINNNDNTNANHMITTTTTTTTTTATTAAFRKLSRSVCFYAEVINNYIN